MKYCGSIDRVRNDLLSDKYKKTWRNLEVHYIFGKTGQGKTRYVMDLYQREGIIFVGLCAIGLDMLI